MIDLAPPELIPLAGLGRRSDDVHGGLPIFDYGLGMIECKTARRVLADFAREEVAGFVEPGRAVSDVVAVAGDEMNVAGTKELPGGRFGAVAEAPGERLCG